MKKDENNFLSALFTYHGNICKIVRETRYEDPAAPPQTHLKIVSLPKKKLFFSYTRDTGLNLSGRAGGVVAGDVLGALQAIPPTTTDKYDGYIPDPDIEAHINFIEKYGFLFPISSDTYEDIDAKNLAEFYNHIKATVRLMSSLAKKNYNSMLFDITYLLFSHPVELKLSTGTYSTCMHSFTDILSQDLYFDDFSWNPDIQINELIPVKDTILGNTQKVDYYEYLDVWQGNRTADEGSTDLRYRKIYSLYTCLQDAPKHIRPVVEFYFYLFKNFGVFNEVRFGRLSYYSKKSAKPDFPAEYKAALLNIAHTVISEEVNYNIAGVHPEYNSKELLPDWNLQNLNQALYFSIFYMKPGAEFYRECANENCKRERFFKITSTASRKKYCCDNCRTAAAVRRARHYEKSSPV